MREALRAFDRVSKELARRNKGMGRQRFYRLLDTDDRGQIISFGVYDSDTKRYAVLESINFSGNFRYNASQVPSEVDDMLSIVRSE